MRRLVLCAVATVLLTTSGHARAARDALVIGVTQFPSTFSPVIRAMLAKSYVLAMTRRPFVAYDQSWELVCMLCVALPTIENGRARREPLPAAARASRSTTRSSPAQPGATACR